MNNMDFEDKCALAGVLFLLSFWLLMITQASTSIPFLLLQHGTINPPPGYTIVTNGREYTYKHGESIHSRKFSLKSNASDAAWDDYNLEKKTNEEFRLAKLPWVEVGK